MTTPESRWDDELAYEVLQRHAAEDLHAGIYDSYLTSVRAIRAQYSRFSDVDDADRAVFDAIDQRYANALRDERPLVPVYSWRPICNALLQVYRVEPETGIVIASTAVTVAHGNPRRHAMALQTHDAFDESQIHLLLEHHEELMESGLQPVVPSE